jgi:D-sedoheptulose 7-phosphate isomerase
MSFAKEFLKDIAIISNSLDTYSIEELAREIFKTKKNNGRLFIIGLGGSASTASHAVNDFRKICNIQTFTPFDNVGEMTARINDQGWDKSIAKWLENCEITSEDVLLVLSVGGGNELKNVSIPIVESIKYAKNEGLKVFSLVGRDDGYAFENSDIVVFTLSPNQKYITPYAESMQSVILHLLAVHPLLQENETTWESIDEQSSIS